MRKKNYVVPRTAQVSVETQNVMVAFSMMTTGGTSEWPPLMGQDGEGEYPEWRDFS